MTKELWWFCPKCERFFPDEDVMSNYCPDCLSPHQLEPFEFDGKQVIASRRYSKRITELWEERNGPI